MSWVHCIALQSHVWAKLKSTTCHPPSHTASENLVSIPRSSLPMLRSRAFYPPKEENQEQEQIVLLPQAMVQRPPSTITIRLAHHQRPSYPDCKCELISCVHLPPFRTSRAARPPQTRCKCKSRCSSSANARHPNANANARYDAWLTSPPPLFYALKEKERPSPAPSP